MIQFNKYRYAALFMFALVLTVSSGMRAASAFSLFEWLGFGDNDEQQDTGTTPDKANDQTPSQPNWAESSATVAANEPPASATPANTGQVRFNDIKLIISNLNPDQRRQLLSDEEAFRNFIQQQAANESVLVAARANNLEQEPFTRLLMQKSAENTLREIYIKRLISKELSDDFPTEEQARTFYENNPDRFTLEERVHMWQIFLPFGEDADEEARNAVKQQAADLKKDIENNKITFAEAATKYSHHIPSRHAGGYMGLIKLSDIKPGIEKSVLELKEGQLSDPVATEDGYHLLQRGSRIASARLPFEQVKPRINQALRQEAEKRLRQAIYNKASETYSLDLDNKRVEEWRLKLRTNL